MSKMPCFDDNYVSVIGQEARSGDAWDWGDVDLTATTPIDGLTISIRPSLSMSIFRRIVFAATFYLSYLQSSSDVV